MNQAAISSSVMHTRPLPQFFSGVQQLATRRWLQLEADPELAAPWHQLFSQVQSPRHVVSELLQNADDAGATSVRIGIHNGSFVFEHDGRDFSESEFSSICRFGFSNKRNLHTIGFRGVGFKSTFSLGPTVRIVTPTLAVAFHRKRFTEPVWIEDEGRTDVTTIRVEIEDASRLGQLEKNLSEWTNSGASLLFFNNIRQLQIHEHVLRRESLGQGPVAGSERIRLTAGDEAEVILFRSEEECFPDDAIAEIREERRVEDLELPPCHVEIVLGLPSVQRLYVVLPTGVQVPLPFSANAPFVQDPARFGIKDPAASPTNRWLLSRVAKLATRVMLEWVGHRALGVVERAEAYELLPFRRAQAEGLAADVAEFVNESIASHAAAIPVLLGAGGELFIPGNCVAIPHELYEVWAEQQLPDIFAPGKELLSSAVSTSNRNKLETWGWLSTIGLQTVLNRLCDGPSPPRPSNLEALVQLWRFVEESINRWDNPTRSRIKVIPVEGKDDLYPATEVVRLAGGRSRLSAGKGVADDEDRQFLAELLLMVDQAWLDYLGAIDVEKGNQEVPARTAKLILGLLTTMRLDAASPWEKIIQQAAKELFGGTRDQVLVEECVRLAHIAASLNVAVLPEFQYVTGDNHLRTTRQGLICDLDDTVAPLVPETWAESHLLHDDYRTPSTSCTRQQWRDWVSSERSKVARFVPLLNQSQKFWNERPLNDLVVERGGTTVKSFHLRSRNFEVRDYDFDSTLCDRWEIEAASDDKLWARIIRQIITGPSEYWLNSLNCEVRQLGSSNTYPLDAGPTAAAWVLRFRTRKCLPDSRGFLSAPAELLMRTPDTEPLMGVEAFVDAELDTEATKPLLRALGVRDSATGSTRLLERLRGLSKVPEPPIHELYKWYDALDRIAARCRPSELENLREVFRSERLVLTNQSDWTTTPEVFQQAGDDDVPGAPTVHVSCAGLPLWGRLGVASRPSPDLVLSWLRALQSGAKLDAANLKRVRIYLQRFPVRVWRECGHWLSIEGSWLPANKFKFVLSTGANIRVSELFTAIKEQTADFRSLSVDAISSLGVDGLSDLADAVEYRSADRVSRLPPPIEKPWLQTLAKELRRVRFADAEQTSRVRSEACRLTKTRWQPFDTLRVVPFIEGTPVGQPHSPDVLWEQETLFVHSRTIVHLIKPLVDELARPFGSSAVTDAIRTCVERPESFVSEYVRFNFEIEEEQPEKPASSEPRGIVPQQPSAPSAPAVDSRQAKANVPTALPNELQNNAPVGNTPSTDNIPSQPKASSPADAAEAVGSPSEGASNEKPFPGADASAAPPLTSSDNPLANRPSGVLPDLADRQFNADSVNGSPSPEPERIHRERSGDTVDRPPLIARFAAANGFRWNSSRSLYLHTSGEAIRRTSGVLDWERLSPSGEVKCIYWVSEQCLARGLEVPAEIWELIRNRPVTYAMILDDGGGNAIDYVGTHLIGMTQSGTLGVFPAKYRIRLVN